MSKYKAIIGRAEFIELADFELSKVPAKTDTGAYSSSIHAKNIAIVTKRGKEYLRFDLLADHPAYNRSHSVETRRFSVVTVSNSFGEAQKRYAVKLRVRLASKKFLTEFTLADRSVKTFPVLLGRQLLNKRFLVDPNVTNIDRKTLKEKLHLKLIHDDEPVDN
jgi:hypothetical protein